MNWAHGDLLDVAAGIPGAAIAFTANATIARDLRLVMGRGAAKRIRDAFPHIDRELAATICQQKEPGCLRRDTTRPIVAGVHRDYHLARVAVPFKGENRSVIAVQVKRHFWDQKDAAAKEACWELAKKSLDLLELWTVEWECPVVLNCPLIGAAGYADREADVRAMVEDILGDAPVTVVRL